MIASVWMEFSDRSCFSGLESSVEFVGETPGPGLEDNPLSIVLSNSEEGPPKLNKKLTEYFAPTRRTTLPYRRTVPRPTVPISNVSSCTSNDSGPSTRIDDSHPSTIVAVGSTSGIAVVKSLRKAVYSTYSL